MSTVLNALIWPAILLRKIAAYTFSVCISLHGEIKAVFFSLIWWSIFECDGGSRKFSSYEKKNSFLKDLGWNEPLYQKGLRYVVITALPDKLTIKKWNEALKM